MVSNTVIECPFSVLTQAYHSTQIDNTPDDVTVKVHMDRLINWNLDDSKAGQALLIY